MHPYPEDHQTLRHDAMATTFRIAIRHDDRLYARQAAAEAFALLDRLERTLSRFLEGSDIFRINRLADGQTTLVSPDTCACLQLALDIQRQTGGAFDVAYASDPPARFELDGRACVVRAIGEGLKLDLGGIGKGFALDRMAQALGEWQIDSALLGAGDSTVLAIGPWNAAAAIGDLARPLRGTALSASGRAVLGDHLIDPHSRRPASRWWRCWAGAQHAARADALSTAFVAMSEPQIRRYCDRHPAVSAYAQPSETCPVVILADRLRP